eukprot:RCo041429
MGNVEMGRFCMGAETFLHPLFRPELENYVRQLRPNFIVVNTGLHDMCVQGTQVNAKTGKVDTSRFYCQGNCRATFQRRMARLVPFLQTLQNSSGAQMVWL